MGLYTYLKGFPIWRIEICLFSPRSLGKIPILTHIFQMGWFNHQADSPNISSLPSLKLTFSHLKMDKLGILGFPFGAHPKISGANSLVPLEGLSTYEGFPNFFIVTCFRISTWWPGQAGRGHRWGRDPVVDGVGGVSGGSPFLTTTKKCVEKDVWFEGLV